MRPSDITDGVPREALHQGPGLDRLASMRPSDITDGVIGLAFDPSAEGNCFNEAVGYYRRSLGLEHPPLGRGLRVASMRPSDITDGVR